MSLRNRTSRQINRGLRQRKRRNGSTLVEAITAIIVLSSFVSGATRLAVVSKQVSDTARTHYQAVNIAKNRCERLKTTDFDQLSFYEESRIRVN